MSTDHSIYLDKNLHNFILGPGFPYLRLNPALINSTSTNEISSAGEQLLLAMHCPLGQLLVISNKHIYIYQIPRQMTRLQTAGNVGIKVGLGYVPILGQLLGAVDDIMGPVGWVWHRISGKAKKERQEEILRVMEALPTKKQIENVVWDFRDPDTLKLILCYEERMLLRNGFLWNTLFKASLQNTVHEPIVITVDRSGITTTVGRKKGFAYYVGKDWDPLIIAADLIKLNRQALEAAGWSVETADQKIVFKNSK